jgi:glycosyltransferase 2 family protein
MKLSTVAQIFGGVVVASAGLYIFLKDLKFIEIWNQIKATEWWVIALVAMLSPLSLWLRTLRWKIMLPSRSGTEKKGLFSIVVIAFMVNNILPARLGEAARALLLWRRNKFTAAESIGSLIFERVLDSLTFLSFLFFPIFFVKGLEHLFLYGMICLTVFLGVIISLVLYTLFPLFTKKQVQKIAMFVPEKMRIKVKKFGRELISNLDWIFSIKKVLSVVVLSYLTVFCYTGMIWLLGIKIESFGFLGSMFGVAFAALGAAIPLSPGYVGTLHAMLLEGLTLVGVTIEKAGAIAVMYHAIGYVTVTLLGIYFFLAINVSFSEIGKAKEELNK